MGMVLHLNSALAQNYNFKSTFRWLESSCFCELLYIFCKIIFYNTNRVANF